MNDPGLRATFDRLIAGFDNLDVPGCREMDDDTPELARYLFLRSFWSECITSWRDDSSWIDRYAAQSRAFREIVESGIDRRILGIVASSIACQVVADVLTKIDDGYDRTADSGCPGWALLETDAEGRVTGREIGRLLDELMLLDPGEDGEKLLL